MTENPNKKAPLQEEDLEGHRHVMIEGDDEDTEGHRNRPDRNRPDRNRPDFMADRNRPDLLEDDDVEGHRFKSDSLLEDDEDVEGHRIKGTNVQPPRDADLGGTEH